MSPGEPFLGNPAVVERLEAKLAHGRLPHALVFSGPDGVGKRTFALKLIQALNCPGSQLYGCGECASCRKVERGIHPDVTSITVEEDASQIRIEQIRALRETLVLVPGEGAVRAAVIDPADRLSAGASNALLKALEEPPPRTYFFLITTNANDLLVTVRSRCQIYHFAPLSVEAIRKLGVSDELLARWSQGSLGRIRQTDVSGLRERRDLMFAFLEAGLTGEPEAIAQMIGSRLAGSREECAELVRTGFFLVSDMLRLHMGLGDGIVNIDLRSQLTDLATSAGVDRLLSAARELCFIEENLRRYVSVQMMTDAALMAIARPNSR